MPFHGQELFEIANSTNGDLTDPAYLAARANCLTLSRAQGIDQVLAIRHRRHRRAELQLRVAAGRRRRISEHRHSLRLHGARPAGRDVDVCRIPRGAEASRVRVRAGAGAPAADAADVYGNFAAVAAQPGHLRRAIEGFGNRQGSSTGRSHVQRGQGPETPSRLSVSDPRCRASRGSQRSQRSERTLHGPDMVIPGRQITFGENRKSGESKCVIANGSPMKLPFSASKSMPQRFMAAPGGMVRKYSRFPSDDHRGLSTHGWDSATRRHDRSGGPVALVTPSCEPFRFER